MVKKKHGKKVDKKQEKTQNISTETETIVSDPQLPTTSQDIAPVVSLPTQSSSQQSTQQPEILGPSQSTIEFPTVADSELVKPKGKGKKWKKQNTQRDDNLEICSETSTSQLVPPIQQQLTSQPAQSLSQQHETTDPSQSTIEFPTVADSELVKPKGKGKKGKKQNTQRDNNSEICSESSMSKSGPPIQQQLTPQATHQPVPLPTRWQLPPQPASATQGRKPHQQSFPQSVEAQTAQKMMSEQVKQQPKAPAKPPPTKAAPAKAPPAKIEPQVGRGLMIPKRSQFNEKNKKGRFIEIDTNHLAIKLNKKLNVIHYDVAIEPDKPKKFMMEVVMLYLRKYFPKKIAAFDGSKNLYSAFPILSETSHTGEIEKVEPDKVTKTKYTIKIQFAAKVNFAEVFEYMKSGSSKDPPQSTLQCLDVVLRHSAHCRFVKIGRSFFSPPAGEVCQLSGGLELWYGHFQSAILGWKPFLNVDVAHKGFTSQLTVLELIKELQPYFSPNKKQNLDSGTLDALEKYLRTLKVEYHIPQLTGSKRTYRVLKVVDSPDDLKFKLDDGRDITVLQYFLKEKKYKIKYPHLPCLSVGNGKRSIYCPVELCTVLGGQNIIAKMDKKQTTNLIRQAATKPDIRRRKIESIINQSNFNSDDVAKEFGISVANKFERITSARILNAPVLAYNDRLEVNPRNGIWAPTLFKVSGTINNWSVIILDQNDRAPIDKLVTQLQTAAGKLGMTISYPAEVSLINRQEILSKLSEAVKKKYQIVMVVVSARGSDYSEVKKNAELKTGVLTQCIKTETINKIDSSTAINILQKMNAKLNNINHVIHSKSKPSCFNEPCMIVGADVTHPSPGQDRIPSIAALACSHDAGAFQYNITLRLQSAKEEIIQDLRGMIKEQLIFFRKSTNLEPKRIIMFRDGVSEGQFEHVLNSELTAIRAACRELSESFQPKVSFFIVQKRHHTRFFPTKPSDADRNGNAIAGTCVDTIITHPTELDYYLLSHASIQGTARPTRYHCIWDDAGMTVDEIEHLTYFLCHLYSRCSRAVSYPTPTYYAHLAAARARVLTEKVTFNMDNLASDQRHIEILDSIRKSNPMFLYN